MRQDKENRSKQKGEGQRGVALVTVLLFLLLLVLLAAALLGTSVIEVRVSDNYQRQTEAFYIAEAGVEQAKQWLKTNMGDAELMSLLLQASQNNPPDQSTLVRADATVVNTPLGNQTFPNATGTYTVVIRDNADDADLTVDTDLQWIINSRGDGPNNSSKIIEVELAAPTVQPSGALNMHGNDSHPDFDQGSSGTGNRIPPGTMDGNPHDVNGNLLPPGGGCPAVPLFATDANAATTELLDDLDDLRSDIVKRANDFCDANGQPACPPGGSACCTPGLWWIRGSAAGPRYDHSDPASYSQLDLSAPELHAIDADYVTITQPPTMILGAPPTTPFGGAPGNTGDPAVDQVPPADMVDQLDIIQSAIDQTPPGDIVEITDGGFNDGGTHTFGSLTDPQVVRVTDVFRIEGNTTFTGFGILIVENRMRIELDSTFNWTGVVIIRGPSPELESRGGGQINGAIYFDSTDGTVRVDMDKATDDLQLTYSCDAIALAISALPLRTVSWIELHQ
ncbi:MAG: pilus assembly PilX N-terminal domain-containing protein [Terriglobia bacterium]